MWANIIALLPVAGLLVLALAHNLGSLRTKVQKVGGGADEVERERQQNREAVHRVEHAGQGARGRRYGGALSRERECQENWQGGLYGEVGWELAELEWGRRRYWPSSCGAAVSRCMLDHCTPPLFKAGG